jgi:hypothetical protein
VYDTVAQPAVVSTLQGYNASIIAYGQTGAGKTYTMEGEPGAHRQELQEERGILPRAVEAIFSYIPQHMGSKVSCLLAPRPLRCCRLISFVAPT